MLGLILGSLNIDEAKMRLKILIIFFMAICGVGCTHIHDGYYYGGYYPFNYGYYSPGYYNYSPGYYNYSPSYSSTYSPTYKYDYSVREYVNQNINNSINIGGPSYYEEVTRQSRSYYIDDTPAAAITMQDGTLQQVNLVEQQRHIIPICHTAMQSVVAKNYKSFQYTTCN